MNSKTHGKTLISIITAMLMVLSAFVVITGGASAQQASVGTVTLNPSGGAFPGQLVTYTWSGVPTDLVPPVYVTVYLNSAPYSTGVASYSNGVLTGTFTMPNDQPGTVFSVSLSYKDSAQNYGVSSYPATGSMNLYGVPVTSLTTTAQSTFGVPYSVKATASYSTSTVKEEFNGTNGYLNGYTNTTFNYATGTTTIPTNASTSGIVSVLTKYSNLVPFTGLANTQKIYVNATPVKGNVAILSLPASAKYYSNFTFSESDISSIVLFANISTTWNGQLVSFVLYGKYQGTISTPGNYSFTGTIKATAPSALANSFSGYFSASYDLVNWYVGSSNIYVNYTLSTSLVGNTNDNVVQLSAQYLNSTVDHTSASTPTGSVIYANTTDVLTIQSGYRFQSIYVDINNPVINGTYVSDFQYGSNKTGDLTFTIPSNSTSNVPAAGSYWYDNLTVSLTPAQNPSLNQTLSGYLNLTVKTINHSPGVAYISPVIWQFSVDSKLYLSNSSGIYLTGSGSTSPLYYNYTGGNYCVLAPEYINLASTFYDYIGNPFLVYINIPYTQYTLIDPYTLASVNVSQNFTYKGTINLSNVFYTTKSTQDNIYSRVLGIDHDSLAGNLNLYVNVSDVKPVLYAISGDGSTTFNVTITGTLVSNSGYMSEQFNGNFTNIVLTFNNSYINNNSTVTISNVTYANYTLRNITGYITDAFVTSAFVSFTSPDYVGTIDIYGNSSVPINKTINLAPGEWAVSNGTITGVSGFGNTSILGWYNTTFTVVKVVPALFGFDAFSGYADLYLNATIMNVSHSLTIDPYYQGMQNASISITILSLPGNYTNNTFNAIDDSQNLTVVGYSSVLSNFELSATFNVTNEFYNLTNTYYYSAIFSQLTIPGTNTPSTESLTFVTGDVPTITNTSTTSIDVSGATPIYNLTLPANDKITLSVTFHADDGNGDFSIDGQITGTYSLLLSGTGTVYYNSTASGSAIITTTIEETQLVFNAQVSGITMTTTPINVASAGPIYLTGVSTAQVISNTSQQYGSGTVTGTVNIEKYYPMSMDGVLITGTINTTGFLANGSAYGVNAYLAGMVELNPNGPVFTNVSTVFLINTETEQPANTGESPVISNYALVSGSGALVVNISDNSIAQIATQTGQVINISLNQLNAKISNVWSAENKTYATLTTDFGTMMVALNNINATVTGISNGIATVQTSLGTIQTSLNNLNAKITALNGTVATIQTTLGTIQTSLSSISTTVSTTATNVNNLVGSVATIQTTLGTIQGQITNVSNGIATIQTKLGTVQTSVSSMSTSVSSTSSSVGSVLVWAIVAVVVAIITLVLVLIAILQINRIAKQYKGKSEIKTPEEKKPPEGGA